MTKRDPCESSLQEATFAAQDAADRTSLPQTVYRDAESCGWWHTNFAASRLARAEVAVTFLPAGYFS